MYSTLPRFTASTLQATAYLFGIALFSISFLVFLNSSISFVVTDVIGQKSRVGNVVGTLGFADELVALVACPLWGIISDKIGVRAVATTGYVVIGASLVGLVRANQVYPDLLLWRMAFSVGGAACTTMVTAVLPTMTAPISGAGVESGQAHGNPDPNGETIEAANTNRHSLAASVGSDMTITPARFQRNSSQPFVAKYRHQRRSVSNIRYQPDKAGEPPMDTSRLAGFVGMFTGIGALLALGLFLPLPTILGKNMTKAQAVQDSFYIVGLVAILVAVFVAIGLRGLPGEHGKSIGNLVPLKAGTNADGPEHSPSTGSPSPSYLDLMKSALVLGITDSNIAIGYIGGFVARASSVGISLFIPLYVNAYFIREGICKEDPGEQIKENCAQAYKLASMLTGISQLGALLVAPLFGWFNARYANKRNLSRLPLTVAAVSGVVGYIAFGTLQSPDPKVRGGQAAIIAVILIGISQIGAIVCSLGTLAHGIQTRTPENALPAHRPDPIPASCSNKDGAPDTARRNADISVTHESTPLLATPDTPPVPSAPRDRTHLKGTIAGVYSLAGGAAILLLTKLGGHLFDVSSVGAPFYLMAAFNAALLLAILAIQGAALFRRARDGRLGKESEDSADDDDRDNNETGIDGTSRDV